MIQNPTYPRLPYWEGRLTKFLQDCDVHGAACDWDSWNCAKWVNEAVKLQNGRDIYGPWAERATDPETAYKEIRKAGFPDLQALIRHEFQEVPLAFANRGDIVFVQPDEVDIVGFGQAVALGVAEPPFFWALGRTCLGRGLLLNAVAAFNIEEPA